MKCKLLILMFVAVNASAQIPCGDLAQVSLPGTTVTAAELVPSGPYSPSSKMPRFSQAPSITLPEYCRVAAVLEPSADSHIEMELWLPATGWNGKFQAVGNGGFAGSISFPAMASALQQGYATASTDTGHKGGNALFGIGHPEKVVDYAYRSVHEMTVQSKALIGRFYGELPKLSYWNGCSTGGRQGLMEAQRYPQDYDGIIAGAPANYHSHLHASDLAVAVPIIKHPSSNLSPEKLAMLHERVMQSCDMLDGVEDGILQSPDACKFDPAALLCKGEAADNCLTPPQIEAVKSIYAPVRFSSGEIIFPGKAVGSETSWMMFNTSQPSSVSLGTFHLTYQDAQWDWRTFDKDRDTVAADEKTGFINAIDPDLRTFKERGGKLILYHGWNDFGISPYNTVNYYSSVLSELGPDQGDWLRLFMLPAVGHCSGGQGPDQADYMDALERWREEGTPPESIIAQRRVNNSVEMTRPLCPYPQVAVYRGEGSTDEAGNFACRLPARSQ